MNESAALAVVEADEDATRALHRWISLRHDRRVDYIPREWGLSTLILSEDGQIIVNVIGEWPSIAHHALAQARETTERQGDEMADEKTMPKRGRKPKVEQPRNKYLLAADTIAAVLEGFDATERAKVEGLVAMLRDEE